MPRPTSARASVHKATDTRSISLLPVGGVAASRPAPSPQTDRSRANSPGLDRSLVQRHASVPEQRIGRPLERANDGPDAAAFHQPVAAAGFPEAAGTQDDIGEFLRTADGHHGAKHAELAWPDTSGEGRGGERISGSVGTGARAGATGEQGADPSGSSRRWRGHTLLRLGWLAQRARIGLGAVMMHRLALLRL